MLDFGSVRIEYGTMLFQLFIFAIPVAVILTIVLLIRSKSGEKLKKIEELEQRVEQLERKK